METVKRNLSLSLLIILLLFPFKGEAGSRAKITILFQNPLWGPFEITLKHKYSSPKIVYVKVMNTNTGEEEWMWKMYDSAGQFDAADCADDYDFICEWLGPNYCDAEFAIYEKICHLNNTCEWHIYFYDDHLQYLTINNVSV